MGPLPRTVKHSWLMTLREKLVKIGAKVTRHSLLRDVPTRRSGGDAELVRGDPRPHRAARVATAGRLWMPRIGATVGQNAGCLEKSTRTTSGLSS